MVKVMLALRTGVWVWFLIEVTCVSSLVDSVSNFGRAVADTECA